MILSFRVAPPTSYAPVYQKLDIFLNIGEVATMAYKLGPQVKLHLVRDALHDPFLSSPMARDDAYDTVFEYFSNFSKGLDSQCAPPELL